MNEIGIRIEKYLKPNLVFKMIIAIDKLLVRLIKKREKIQIVNNKTEGGNITTDTIDAERIIREYFEQFHGNKLDNLEEMDEISLKLQLPKWLKEKIDNLNRLTSIKEIKFIVKQIIIIKIKPSNRENSRATWFHW